MSCQESASSFGFSEPCKPDQVHRRINRICIVRNYRTTTLSLPQPIHLKIEKAMLHSIKPVLTYQHVLLSRSLSSKLCREASAVRFCTKPDSNSGAHKMDKSHKPSEETKHGDAMSHSFGEGYATRSDEEGFGGIYGGNQSMLNKTERDEFIHENYPAYDKTQGSEVKEKEKARHQSSAQA